ncbi:MAG: hypothetical protein ACFFA5_02720 [Promethearchaeota archaeon]
MEGFALTEACCHIILAMKQQVIADSFHLVVDSKNFMEFAFLCLIGIDPEFDGLYHVIDFSLLYNTIH